MGKRKQPRIARRHISHPKLAALRSERHRKNNERKAQRAMRRARSRGMVLEGSDPREAHRPPHHSTEPASSVRGVSPKAKDAP